MCSFCETGNHPLEVRLESVKRISSEQLLMRGTSHKGGRGLSLHSGRSRSRWQGRTTTPNFYPTISALQYIQSTYRATNYARNAWAFGWGRERAGKLWRYSSRVGIWVEERKNQYKLFSTYMNDTTRIVKKTQPGSIAPRIGDVPHSKVGRLFLKKHGVKSNSGWLKLG